MNKVIAALVLGSVTLIAQAENKETIFKNQDWISVKTVDPMTDKVSCYIWGANKPYYQVSNESLYVGYRGRGGIRGPGYSSVGSLVKYRYDDEPASDYMQVTKMEGEINALIIPIRTIFNKKRLRIQTGTVVGNVEVEDINLETLQPAVESCVKYW